MESLASQTYDRYITYIVPKTTCTESTSLIQLVYLVPSSNLTDPLDCDISRVKQISHFNIGSLTSSIRFSRQYDCQVATPACAYHAFNIFVRSVKSAL